MADGSMAGGERKSDNMLALADRARGPEHGISYIPEGGALVRMRDDLGLLGLRKVRLGGTLSPEGTRDWRLTARLGATVTQPCVVTLKPVTTRIEADVVRHFVADWREPDEAETEMDSDDSREPLPASVDLAALVAEELSLALPPYPRAAGAVFEEPGPAEDEDTHRPFAGLAALRSKPGGEN